MLSPAESIVDSAFFVWIQHGAVSLSRAWDTFQARAGVIQTGWSRLESRNCQLESVGEGWSG